MKTSRRVWYRIEVDVRGDIFSALESAAPVLIDAAIAQPPDSPERHNITTALARLYVALDELPSGEKPDAVRTRRAFRHYEERAKRAIAKTVESRGPQGITKKDWIRSGGLHRQVFNKTDYVKAMQPITRYGGGIGELAEMASSSWGDWPMFCQRTYYAIYGGDMPECTLEGEARDLYHGVMVANVWPGPEGDDE